MDKQKLFLMDDIAVVKTVDGSVFLFSDEDGERIYYTNKPKTMTEITPEQFIKAIKSLVDSGEGVVING